MLRSFFAILFVTAFQSASFAGLDEARRFLSTANNFYRDVKPETVTVEGVTFPYDPLTVTAVASLQSRTPDARANDWFERELPPNRGTNFCRGSMKAYVRLSRTNSPYTFLILPGSYSTFYRRSYVNRTAGLLTTEFNDPTLIAFDGFISSAFLNQRCSKIPWDINALGSDLYSRLRVLLHDLNADPKRTGIIGYSGGASLAMAVLAADSTSLAARRNFRFGLGGVIASPLLHPRSVFENLDAARSEIHKNRDTAFTNMDPGNFLFLLKNAGQPSWDQMPKIAARYPADFRRRYFNELVIVDLKDMLSALGRTPPANDELSYVETFIHEGFGSDHPELKRDERAAAFDAESDIRRTITRIQQPLLIHSAKDDPNNSNHKGHEQPEAVQAVVDFARTRPNVIMINPTFAAHVTIVLEPNYADLLRHFFENAY